MPPKKTVTGTKSERADTPKPAAKKATPKKSKAETETAPPPASKGLKRESSGGTSNSLFVSGDLENVTQEMVEKDTVLFDYTATLSAARSVAGEKNGSRHSTDLLKLISWNVAGLRAILKNGFNGSELEKMIIKERPDVLCLQETKLSDLQQDTPLPASMIQGYVFAESVSVAKKGYAGTRTYFREDTFDVAKCQHFFDFDLASSKVNNGSLTTGYAVGEGGNSPALPKDIISQAMDSEGRLVASILVPKDGGSEPFLLLNTYVPNSGMKLERLDYRVMDFDATMRTTLTEKATSTLAAHASAVLGSKGKTPMNIIWTGDLNVAERNYDRFHNGNFKGMQKVPGFTLAERQSFRKTLQGSGDLRFKDTFRELHPNHRGAYTFYSKMFNQRAKGNGWRLDYFIASTAAATKVVATAILNEYTASDHIPLVLWMKK